MKLITSNLIKFAIFFALGSILFRFGLTWAITNHGVFEIWIFAILYFILNATLGWFFGKKDYESFPLNDVGFRFHLITFVIFNGIWELWFFFGLQSHVENVKIAHQTAFFWGIFLVLHFIIYMLNRKNTIGGLEKSEIFE